MATTATKVKSAYGTLDITILGLGSNATSPSVNSEGYPFGSALVEVTGTSPTNVTMQGSNDGINFVPIGGAATSFPALAAMSVTTGVAPCKFYQFVVSGGDATTQIAIYIMLMGSRG